MLPGQAVAQQRCCFLECWQEEQPAMRAVDPSQDPSTVPVFELQGWVEAFWPAPSPQNQFPQMMTGTNKESNH